jgi:hypothetical protein
VRIQYDPAKSKYLAIDINTGFAILRHHDGARLRAICDRMNVQIIDGEGSSKVKWDEASRKPQSSDPMQRTAQSVHQQRQKP